MFHIIDLITNVLLLTLAIVVLPSALIGGLSAVDWNQQSKQNINEQVEREDPQLHQPSVKPSTEPRRTLRPLLSAADRQAFHSDPLAPLIPDSSSTCNE
ncbi:hypothetical protein C1752_14779 [Acaryochloris thomasi RCC1774]|uniref:Uncharacterized protein n=1 Tax=Acaryochloris thomasi RCC1774 TaxID=1764569 RepID=A0A2W1JJ35_9CYAN|nr:hypothetical protein [Acaryochloris thomasi]PZD70274.1 hypothetical protein C1752_14779 [Acaryochloris thomasi RCC1774]